MGKPDMRTFWDDRARENALFFVDDRLDYTSPDDARFWAEGERLVNNLTSLLDFRLEPDETVLDIGCGVGRVSRVLAGRVGRVIALDVSSEMLRLAKEHGRDLKNVEWIQGDGSSLQPLADNSVDGCISFVVFQHIPDPAITLGYVREMGRVLRPGGWAAFHVSNDPSVHMPRPAKRGISRAVRVLLGRAPRGQADTRWLGSAVDLNDLECAARQSGLDLERVEGAGTQYCLVLARRTSVCASAK